MLQTDEPSIKVYGREIGLGDWIAPNVNGVYHLGRVITRQDLYRQFGDCEIQTSEGDRIAFTLNRDGHYNLFSYLPEQIDQHQEDVLDSIRGVGAVDSQRRCRVKTDCLKRDGLFKYFSRDGRYIFKDGSAMRVLPDASRILYGRKGEEVPWPVRGRPR